MDAAQDTTFVDLLSQLPDPRHARGKRHDWCLILTVSSAALAAGCATPHAIAQWVSLHAAMLQSHLCPLAPRLSSESTIVRALRSMDVIALETHLALVADALPLGAQPGAVRCPNGEYLDGQAIDGGVAKVLVI
ncbi:MAG TPA: transposase family protein, partial [Herpetosiphonaceae bacterium]